MSSLERGGRTDAEAITFMPSEDNPEPVFVVLRSDGVPGALIESLVDRSAGQVVKKCVNRDFLM